MDLVDEFVNVSLGDERLNRRLVTMVERLAVNPAQSIPSAMKTAKEVEGAYRLLNNPAVTPDAILEPHIAATVERAAQKKLVVVPHDTTEIRFPTVRRGLGRLNDEELGRGFFLHPSIAVSFEEQPEPLGVLAAQTYMRFEPPTRKKTRKTHLRPEEERESRRWRENVEAVAARLPPGTQAVHVMDREADNYLLLSQMVAGEHRFVIRNNFDRRIVLDERREPTLRHALAPLVARMTRTIRLSPRERKPLAHRRNPKLEGRTAQLELCATKATFRRPDTVNRDDASPEELTLHVVHVREVDPPEDYEPVDWKLLTTEPIDTAEQIAAVVDMYLLRWVIEEFFKALKTGCDFEGRQLENPEAILNALALFLPMAADLLRLRWLSRGAPARPAATVLTPTQIRILQAHRDVRLGPSPTIRDAFLAIARLGGHLKRNGEPGWQILGRGYSELLSLERGARLVLDREM